MGNSTIGSRKYDKNELNKIKQNHPKEQEEMEINEEAWRIIFLEGFSPKQICRMSRVCNTFYKMTSGNEFWKKKFTSKKKRNENFIPK